LHHILSNCSTALAQGRYTWRHDSVLTALHEVLQEFIDTRNNNNTKSRARPQYPDISKCFVTAGKTAAKRPTSAKSDIMSTGNDWELLIDYQYDPIVFPPEICSTAERPDIIIWSRRRVILAELTCPAEEGIKAAEIRKLARYNKELVPLITGQFPAWTVHLFTIEAGVRGFLAHSFRKFLSKIGLPKPIIRNTLNNVSEIVATCSYYIYQSINADKWNNRPPLILSGATPQP